MVNLGGQGQIYVWSYKIWYPYALYISFWKFTKKIRFPQKKKIIITTSLTIVHIQVSNNIWNSNTYSIQMIERDCTTIAAECHTIPAQLKQMQIG